MATKTITITEDAYEVLKSRKGPNESFTDVVIKLGAHKGKFSDCIGLWKDMDDGEWEKIRKELDKSWATWKNDVPLK